MFIKRNNNKSNIIEKTNNNTSLYQGVINGVVQGASLGTGSAIANRAISALLDDKKNDNKCNEFFIKFQKCINENNNDFSICKELLNNYEKCKI